MNIISWKQALTRAISAEVAAEKAAASAEGDRRRTWWTTTWALAAVPRSEWGTAQAEYIKRTKHSATTAKRRRSTGERLPESLLGETLPQSRFAEAAANWIGKDGDEAKVAEAVKLLAQAEKDEMSLREFSQALTGRPWTNTIENLTKEDEQAIVERVARTRPRIIAEAVIENEEVAEAVTSSDEGRNAVRKGMERAAEKARTRNPRPMPTRKVKLGEETPEEEKPLSELELQILQTDFDIIAGDAADVRKAHDLVRKMRPYFTEERRYELAAAASRASEAWELVRGLIMSEGVTDQALHDLIDQTQGGS